MTTLFLLLITALIFWGLGWKNAEDYHKKKNPKKTVYSDYLRDIIAELHSEIVTLKSQNKN